MSAPASYLFTVLGGTMYFAGPILGAVVGVFATVMLATLTRAWQLYLGLGFLAVVLFAPGGIAGLIAAHGAPGAPAWHVRCGAPTRWSVSVWRCAPAG